MAPLPRVVLPEGIVVTVARALAWWPLWTAAGEAGIGRGLTPVTALFAGWMVSRVARASGERIGFFGIVAFAVAAGIAEWGTSLAIAPAIAHLPVGQQAALGLWVSCVALFEAGRLWFSLGFESAAPRPAVARRRRLAAHGLFAAYALVQLVLPHARGHGHSLGLVGGVLGPPALVAIVGPALACALARPIDAVRVGPTGDNVIGRRAIALVVALIFFGAVAWETLDGPSRGTSGLDPLGVILAGALGSIGAAVALFLQALRAARFPRAIVRGDTGDSLQLSVDAGQSWIPARTAEVRSRMELCPDDVSVTLVSFQGSLRPASDAFRGSAATVEQLRFYEETPAQLARVLRARSLGWVAWAIVALAAAPGALL